MLTQQEVNNIRSATGWSDEIIRYIRSIEEAKIYIHAGLKEARVCGRAALIRRDIN